MVNRCRRGPDGIRVAQGSQVRAGTTAFLLIPWVTKGVARVEPRWEDGIFLGVSDLYVGTGMHQVRTLRRR